MKILLVNIAIFLTITITMAQSPWNQPKGGYYTQIGFNSVLPASAAFDKGTNTVSLNRKVTDQTVQFYGEYGFSTRWTGAIVLPFKTVGTGKTIEPSGSFPRILNPENLTGLGNVQVSVKYGLSRKVPLALSLMASLPTAQADTATGLRTGFEATSLAPALSYGKGWNKAYAYLSSGITLRTNAYSADYFGGAEFGYKLGKLWAIGVLDIRQSFNNGNFNNGNSVQTVLYANNQSWLAYGLKLSYAITNHWGITISGFGAGGGNLVQAAPSTGISLYYKNK